MGKPTVRQRWPPINGRPTFSASNQPPVKAEVEAWIREYTPRTIGLERWESSVRGFVVPALLALEPAGMAIAGRYAYALTRIADWCVSEGLGLDPEIVLDPDTVERFTSTALAGSRSKATYRSDLRRMGRKLTNRAPWEPRPEAVRRRVLAQPYTANELDTLRRIASEQSTPERRRAARVLIGLGAGAGLDGRWCTRIRPADVSMTGAGILVRVRPPQPRLVPVLAEFEEDLADLARSPSGEFLVGGSSSSKNRASSLVARLDHPHGSPRLCTRRLRSSWLLHHLTVGTRLPELARAAGLVGVAVLSDLLEFVPPLPPEEAQLELRGGS